ncbi:hypothetical protein SAMD00019534_033190, partial [Acytostelium subglobosum LB1]|uniref:hypothetical protein n=1 Tax=Acytostelium subglobosum LB1 TaxID=1410327 RepID=UPI0006447F3A
MNLALRENKVDSSLFYLVENTKRPQFSPFKIYHQSCCQTIGTVIKRDFNNNDKMYCLDPDSVALTLQLINTKTSRWKKIDPNIFEQLGVKLVNQVNQPQSQSNNAVIINGNGDNNNDTIMSPETPNKNTHTLHYLTTIIPKQPNMQQLMVPNMDLYDFQVESLYIALQSNSILILPTGLGKTMVSALLIQQMHICNGQNHIDTVVKRMALFVVARVPLVNQQALAIKTFFPLLKTVTIHGGQKQFTEITSVNDDRPDVIFCTADTILNCLLVNQLRPKDFHLVVLDEVHNCSGGHPFARLAKIFTDMTEKAYSPLIFGMTASPTSTSGSIEGALKNLEMTLNAASFIPHSIKEYKKEVATMNLVPFTFNQLQSEVREVIESAIREIASCFHCELPMFSENLEYSHQRIGSFIHAARQLETYIFNLKINNKFTQTLTYQTIHLFKLIELLSIIEIESVRQLENQVHSELLDASNADINQAFNVHLRHILQVIQSRPDRIMYDQLNSEKYSKLADLIKSNLNGPNGSSFKCIIFVRMRTTALRLLGVLRKEEFNEQINSKYVVGNVSNDDGMEYSKQSSHIQKFREGQCRLIVSTSVLEEGIDVPSCNVIICFEEDLQLRSLIQRRGRARERNSQFHAMQFQEDPKRPPVNPLIALLRREKIMMNLVRQRMAINGLNDPTKLTQFMNDYKRFKEQRSPDCLDATHKTNHGPSISPQLISLFLTFYHSDAIGAFDQSTFSDITLQDKLQFIFREFVDNTPSKATATTTPTNTSPSSSSWMTQTKMVAIDAPMSWSHNLLINLRQLLSIWTPSHYCWLQVKTGGDHHSNIIATPSSSRTNNSTLQTSVRYLEGGDFITPTQFRTVWREHSTSSTSTSSSSSSSATGVSLLFSNDANRLTLYFHERHQQVVFIMGDLENFLLYDLFTSHFYLTTKRSPRIYQMDPTTNQVASRQSCLPSCPLSGPMTFVFRFKLDMPQGMDETYLADLFQLPLYYAAIHTITKPITIPRFNFYLNRRLAYLVHIFETHQQFGKASLTQDFYDTIEDLANKGQIAKAEQMLNLAMATMNKSHLPTPNCAQGQATLPPVIDLPTNHCLIKKARLTPTRVIFLQPILMMCNRAIRMSHPDNFLIVQLTEEDGGEIIENQTLLNTQTHTRLLHGINIQGDGTYFFLGSSSSQSRRGTCWFYRSRDGEDLVHVRNTLVGETSLYPNARKYLRCLNLVFPSTRPVMLIDGHDYHEGLDDIIINGHNFSEGVGYIGIDTAQDVITRCSYPNSTSAFQIRIGGNKGVVSIHPTIRRGLYLRNSMRKFHTTPEPHNRTLEIISISSNKPCYLNRQIINLFSGLGVPDHCFMELLQDALDNLALMFYESDTSRTLLESIDLFRDVSWAAVKADPMVRQILALIYQKRVANYRDKSFIPIPKARTLLGVLDETNTLVAGQVFIKLSTIGLQGTLITGRVAVCKNPCLHPGDVRLLEAVDVPALHHLLDVVVFAARGSVPDFKQCSGSDLDGDRYFCCFDQDMLEHMDEHEPYIGSEDDGSASSDNRPIDQTALMDQYMDSIQRGTLGQIALSHLAVSDYHSPTHPLAINLAKQHYVEVDAPKTGVHAMLPLEVEQVIGNYERFPSFMERSLPSKKYWQSTKVLGKLYDQCKQLSQVMMYTISESSTSSTSTSCNSGAISVYIDQARQDYNMYKVEVILLLNRYEVGSEEELMVQCSEEITERNSRKEIIKEGNLALIQIQRRWRQEFIRQLNLYESDTLVHLSPEVRLSADCKVAAWRAVADEDRTDPVRSFYWIVQPFATQPTSKAKMDNNQEQLQLSLDIVKLFKSNAPQLIRTYTERVQIASTLVNILHRFDPIFKDAQLFVYGSSSLFLFEEHSDLDLHLLLNRGVNDADKATLYRTIEAALKCTVAEIENIKYLEHSFFPIVRFKMCTVHCDLSLNSNGTEKTLLITEYYRLYPFLLPFIYIIVQWGRECGLLSSMDRNGTTTQTRLLKTWSLVWMSIHYCIESGIIRPVTVTTSSVPNPEARWWTSLIDSIKMDNTHVNNIGRYLLGFYRFYTMLLGRTIWRQEKLVLMCPLDTVDFPSLLLGTSESEHNSSFLFETFQLAYHTLAASCSDINEFIKKSLNNNTKIIHLDGSLSRYVSQDEQFFTGGIMAKTGASLSLHRQRKKRYLLKISGDPLSIQHAMREVTKLYHEVSRILLKVHRNIVSGAGTLLLFDGAADRFSKIRFEDTNIMPNINHFLKRRFRPVAIAPSIGTDGLEEHRLRLRDSYLEFTKQCFTQIHRLYKNYIPERYGEVQVYMRFGS